MVARINQYGDFRTDRVLGHECRCGFRPRHGYFQSLNLIAAIRAAVAHVLVHDARVVTLADLEPRLLNNCRDSHPTLLGLCLPLFVHGCRHYQHRKSDKKKPYCQFRLRPSSAGSELSLDKPLNESAALEIGLVGNHNLRLFDLENFRYESSIYTRNVQLLCKALVCCLNGALRYQARTSGAMEAELSGFHGKSPRPGRVGERAGTQALLAYKRY
jgi:hypothetical protein